LAEYLFTYGTLLAAHAPPEIRDVVSKLRVVGTGRIRGRLYDFGEYPGAILDEAAETYVVGSVLELPASSVLRVLDAYEGYDPASPDTSLFLRRRCHVILTNGDGLNCWAYTYNRDTGSAPIVPRGDYSQLKATKA
jgi:gamma-glutamylcyclotransferase (GGCT)/AIG2-like uncharacterized protein YtfP